MADQLVAFVTSSQVSNGSSALAGLEAQASALTKQVNKYDQEIQTVQAGVASYGQTSVEGQQDIQLLGSLTTAEADASLQLQSVNSQIAAAKLGAPPKWWHPGYSGSGIGDRAVTAQPTSPDRHRRHSRISDRPRLRRPPATGSNVTTRDEIAEVAGVPVVLSLSVGRLRRSSEWLTLLREHNPTCDRNVERPQSTPSLGPSRGQTTGLTIITLADDSRAWQRSPILRWRLATCGDFHLAGPHVGRPGITRAERCLRSSHFPHEAARPNLRLFKGSPPVDEARRRAHRHFDRAQSRSTQTSRHSSREAWSCWRSQQAP